MKKIYLDQASTSFPKSSSVADAVYQYLSGSPVNVGRGGYQAAYDVEETIFETREPSQQERSGHLHWTLIMTVNMVSIFPSPHRKMRHIRLI